MEIRLKLKTIEIVNSSVANPHGNFEGRPVLFSLRGHSLYALSFIGFTQILTCYD
jgi:hypothetical protein